MNRRAHIEALTPEERNKIMGHRQGDSRVYVQYYMSNFNDVDCQSICFGSAPQHDAVHLAGRLLRHSDAPTTLTEEQLFEVSQHPELAKCRQKSAKLLEQMRSWGYSTRAAAEGTELAAQYDRHKKKACSLSKRLRHARLAQAVKDFHDSVHIDEVNRQLNGIKLSNVIAPPTASYELPERAKVARLFSQAVEVTDRKALLRLRIDLISTLAGLCTRRESPCRRQNMFRIANTPNVTGIPRIADETITRPAIRSTRGRERGGFLFCPFCRWADAEVGEDQRQKSWRMDSLARHMRTQHLRAIATPFDCPYKNCLDILKSPSHFVNHVELRHQLRLPPAILGRVRECL